MRTEQEIFDLVLQIARKDERIRTVILEGSRANPNAPKDILQDYDIVYIVTELASFVDDPAWVQCFGELLIMQIPETMQDPPPANNDSFTYLMQFRDGTRIDLSLYILDAFKARGRDSLSILLLDKDGVFDPFPPPDESDYYPQPPTQKAFADCCNEFWWVSTYVAKGLWRGETTYAKFMLDEIVRAQLMKLLTWYIGMQTSFRCNPGKQGKYFQKYLEADVWEKFLQTYTDADCEHNWTALFAMTDLFRTIALQVAKRFALEYPDEEYQRVLGYLRHIKDLPQNGNEVS